MAVLVTGAAGFIGFHVSKALLARGQRVIGVDNLNPYYDVSLKRDRLALLNHEHFSFVMADISDRNAMSAFVGDKGISEIIHLAAQAGVRHSMVDPYSYVQSNVMGHLVILEIARQIPGLKHLVYASSSSVYGLNTDLPFRESDRVDRPSSLYAATKRADELISHVYGHLYGVPQTGLRFFTVYGPWGRPDMAYFSFARAIMLGEPIALYEGQNLSRDFTYIDDIVEGVLAAAARPPIDGMGPRLLNLGNRKAEPVSRLIELLEDELGRKGEIVRVARPAADVEATWADIKEAQKLTGFAPRIDLQEGVARFARWFKAYFAKVEQGN